nr:PREDICTED: coiled-coil domain-containing protein 81-like [Struthio camelus australis]
MHIWGGVSDYIVEQLVLNKDVRIIRLGTFGVRREQVPDGKKGLLTIRRPTFCLARSLAECHGLTHDKAYVPGHKQAEPLKCARISLEISFSRQIVEACLDETMYLLSCCLASGKNVALVLNSIGMLLIEGTVVKMRFSRSLLQRLNESEQLVEALLGMPEMRDAVISDTETAASLTRSGSVIVFPTHELEASPRESPFEAVKPFWEEERAEDESIAEKSNGAA